VAAVVVHLQGFQWGCCYPPTSSNNIHENQAGNPYEIFGLVAHDLTCCQTSQLDVFKPKF